MLYYLALDIINVQLKPLWVIFYSAEHFGMHCYGAS